MYFYHDEQRLSGEHCQSGLCAVKTGKFMTFPVVIPAAYRLTTGGNYGIIRINGGDNNGVVIGFKIF